MIRTTAPAFTSPPGSNANASAAARGRPEQGGSAFDSAFASIGAKSHSPDDDGSHGGPSSTNAHASRRFASDLAQGTIGSGKQQGPADGKQQSSSQGDITGDGDADQAADAKHKTRHQSSSGEGKDTEEDAATAAGKSPDHDDKRTGEKTDAAIAAVATPPVPVTDTPRNAGKPQDESVAAEKSRGQAATASGGAARDDGGAAAKAQASDESGAERAQAQAAATDDAVRPPVRDAGKPKQDGVASVQRPEVTVVNDAEAAGPSEQRSALHQLFGRLAATGPAARNERNAKVARAGDDQPVQEDSGSEETDGKEKATTGDGDARGTARKAASDLLPGLSQAGHQSGGPGSNAARLATQIVSRADWTQALSKPAGTGTPGTINAMKLQLNPAELGTVTANLRVSGGQLVIHLQVETTAAYRQLSNDSSAIIEKLKGHGYAVETVTVQHVGGADRPATPPAQAQHHGSGANAQSGGGQPGGSNAGAGSGQNPGNRHGGGDAASDFMQTGRSTQEPATDEGGAARSRTGGVYI